MLVLYFKLGLPFQERTHKYKDAFCCSQLITTGKYKALMSRTLHYVVDREADMVASLNKYVEDNTRYIEEEESHFKPSVVSRHG